MQTDYAAPKGAQNESSVSGAALTAHPPSNGTIACPCPVGPEPRLRVEMRTRPFDTHSPRESGQCSGCCGNQQKSQCKGDQTSSTLEQRESRVRTGLTGEERAYVQGLNRV